ncbi:MAG: hypothetical protein K8F59_17155 [Rhodobacteraceae bacterium]|nr:hypothetical protein [Paracoccaceae bacterium]
MKTADLEDAGQIEAIGAGNPLNPAILPSAMILADTDLPVGNPMAVKAGKRQRCGAIIDGIDIQDANSRLEVPVPKVNTLMKTCANRHRLALDIPAFADQIGGKAMLFSSAEPADIWFSTFFKGEASFPASQQEASQ